MVVFFHLTLGREAANAGFNLGITGVDLFFIISGFVISMSIHNVSTWIQFVINRVSRLYPTYWACVTFTFLLIMGYSIIKADAIQWAHYLGNLTMFQYYLGIADLDVSYWTMIVEMNFYIFILFLFRLNLLKFVVWIGLALTLLIAIVSHFYWNAATQSIFKFIPLLQFFPLFFAGIIFYKWQKNSQKRFSYFLMLLVCLQTQAQLYGIASGRSNFFISHTQYSIMLLIFFILFLLFVHNKLIYIVNKPLLYLGKISFALYLTHQYLLLQHVLPFLVNRMGVNFWIASLFICLPVSLAIATTITYLIEIPYSPKMKYWLMM